MLESLKYILTIAAAERKMLYRTPKFWVLAALGGLFTVIMLIGTTVASILDRTPEGEFALEGTDAWIALYFFSYMQTIIIIFVAGDFRRVERQSHLDQVMLSRSMTTANWVLGKYFGVVSSLLVLNIGFLMLSSIGRLVKVYFLGVQFNMVPAVEYFMIATLPSILFMTALVYFLISLLRVQALAILIPLGYVGAILFYFRHQYQGLLDYGCFAAPLFYSDLIGYGHIDTILWQRVFYTLLAFALLSGAILLYPRLRESVWSQRITQFSGVICLVGAITTAWSIRADYAKGIEQQTAARAAQAQWAKKPTVQVPHYDFYITLGDGNRPLQVDLRMAVHNPHDLPVDTLYFSLNNELKIQSHQWQSDEKAVLQHQHHTVILIPSRPILPHAVDTLMLSYAGSIDAESFMLNQLPEAAGVLPKSGNGPFILGDESAWLDDHSAVLPAQSGWYPVPGVVTGYAYDSPRPANFATATIRIQAPKDVAVLTQGIPQAEQIDAGNHRTTFEVNTPTPAFSLNAGPYKLLSRQFNQTEVALYFYDGHLMNYEVFDDVADTCFQTVERMFEIYEDITGTPYPYARLSLIEAPLQMQLYPTRNGVENILLQPGVIMISEILMAGKRFDKEIERAERNARRNGRDDTMSRLKRDIFVKAVMSILMPDRNDRDGSLYSPIRNYVHFQTDLTHPILNRGLELQLHETAERRMRDTFFPQRFNVSESANDRLRRNDDSTARTLRRRYNMEIDSIMAVMQQTALTDIRPTDDGTSYRAVVEFKAPPVLDMLRDRIGMDAYQAGIAQLYSTYRYQRVDLQDFQDVMQMQSQTNLQTFSDQWLEGTSFPGYRITQADVEKWDTGRMQIAYQVKVRVQNGEQGDGFVRVEVKTRRDRIRRSLALNSFEEKEMHIITQDVPVRVQVIPFFARNRGSIIKPVNVGRRLHRGTPSDTVFTVPSTLDSLDFIIDDQDEGFFMPREAEARYLRPPVQTASWQQLTRPEAYGRYIFGFKYRWASDGDYPVRWEAKVPKTGFYELSLHMPPRQAMQRQYHLIIETADDVEEATISPQGVRREWWPIGRYRFDQSKTGAIELSDKGAGYILADAVRWTFVGVE